MTKLIDLIRDLIKAKGPLSVADYMELCLQHPEFGYYRKGDPLGDAGDFTTAPEISQMFGELIGLWCTEVWKLMGSPSSFALVELGPGRGTLMQDALRATAKSAGFQAALKIFLMESNETFRRIQAERLQGRDLTYISAINDIPELPMIILANEFFDALPIRQFEKTDEGWTERCIGLDQDQLVFQRRPLDAAFMMLIPGDLSDAPVGTFYEISIPSLSLLRDTARHVVRHGGAALIIDYGYTKSLAKPSLQALSNHKMVSALETPGESDLTAHVDFAALSKSARLQNAKVLGPVGQGEFLENLGIEIRAAQLKKAANVEQAATIDAGLRRLTDAADMGTLFKVMVLTANPLSEVPGL